MSNVVPLTRSTVDARPCARCKRPIGKGERYYPNVRMPDGTFAPVHEACMGESGPSR